jgi:hypothetical protein
LVYTVHPFEKAKSDRFGIRERTSDEGSYVPSSANARNSNTQGIARPRYAKTKLLKEKMPTRNQSEVFHCLGVRITTQIA